MRNCFLLILVVLFFSYGCQQQEITESRQEELMAVNRYVIEMTVAMEELMPDLQGWIRIYYGDDFPYRYDRERVEWLAQQLVELETIDLYRYAHDYPSLRAIQGWEVVAVRDGEEWLLSGEELASALSELYGTSHELIAVITMIIKREGILDEEESDRVNFIIKAIPVAIDRSRSVLRM